jgi:hypothetical protein
MKQLGWAALSCVVWVGVHVVTMVYGWGLTPVSWWYIVGFGLFGVLFSKVLLLTEKPTCPKCGHNPQAHVGEDEEDAS